MTRYRFAPTEKGALSYIPGVAGFETSVRVLIEDDFGGDDGYWDSDDDVSDKEEQCDDWLEEQGRIVNVHFLKRHDDIHLGYFFHPDDRGTAMLFKLTWGGK